MVHPLPDRASQLSRDQRTSSGKSLQRRFPKTKMTRTWTLTLNQASGYRYSLGVENQETRSHSGRRAGWRRLPGPVRLPPRRLPFFNNPYNGTSYNRVEPASRLRQAGHLCWRRLRLQSPSLSERFLVYSSRQSDAWDDGNVY